MWSAKRATSRWTTWSAWPRRSACRLTSCSSPELHLPASRPRSWPVEPRRSAEPCGPPHGMPRTPPGPSQVPRHRAGRRPIPSGPPPIPSGISPVLPCRQAWVNDPPLTEPCAPPPTPRAPHFQLGTVTALRLAPRTKSPAREALWVAAGTKWLAPEALSRCARGETGGKPLGTRDTRLTSGGAPVKTACAPRCLARGPQAEAGVRAQAPRAQAHTPCEPDAMGDQPPRFPTGPRQTQEKIHPKYQCMVFFGTAVTGAQHGKKHQHRFGRSL